MAAPFAVAVHDASRQAAFAFGIPMAASIVASLIGLLWWFFKRNASDDDDSLIDRFNAGDAALSVGAIWFSLGLIGAVPLALSGHFPVINAIFESVSGFTTTGATILNDVESLPRAVNLWRCETHWLGGMGVIVLVVALMPLLGIGGVRLISAETTGPEKGKLTARVADTAKALWIIYSALTAFEAVALRLCGLSWFDSVCHALSTLGTGGFSTRNASLAAFGNSAAEWICTLFMFAASVNFALYFRLLFRRDRSAFRSSEFNALCAIFLSSTIAIALILALKGVPVLRALRLAAFQVGAISSTTGFASDDFTLWPPAAQAILFLLFFIGGSSGSTAGGVKIVRWSILAKQTVCELGRILHPRAILTPRLDGRPIREGLLGIVGAFIFAYFALVSITTLAGTLAGLPIFESFTAALSMVGNVGPAFESLGPASNYSAIHPALKLFYCTAMIAGRLEIFTLLAMFANIRSPK